MKVIIFIISLVIIVSSCVYDPPKETIRIVNTSKTDTIFVYSGHCSDNVDSTLMPQKFYFSTGFNSMVKHPHFLDPLDTLRLALGYHLMPVINSCSIGKQKYLLSKRVLLNHQRASI